MHFGINESILTQTLSIFHENFIARVTLALPLPEATLCNTLGTVPSTLNILLHNSWGSPYQVLVVIRENVSSVWRHFTNFNIRTEQYASMAHIHNTINTGKHSNCIQICVIFERTRCILKTKGNIEKKTQMSDLKFRTRVSKCVASRSYFETVVYGPRALGAYCGGGRG